MSWLIFYTVNKIKNFNIRFVVTEKDWGIKYSVKEKDHLCYANGLSYFVFKVIMIFFEKCSIFITCILKLDETLQTLCL